MNFKEWLYNEAFELPFQNIQKIYEYYAEGYKQYLKSPRTKIPPKLFNLDLSGSKYEFLQYLNPHVEIYVKGSLENAAGIYHGISQNHLIAGVPDAKIGKISLSFSNYEHVNYSTIEHEVLHFIQDLIKEHSKHKDVVMGDLRRGKRKKPAPGGLPPMSLVKRLMKDREIDVDGNKKEKRTKHEYRPIEYYTNLNSLIRSLQYYYIVLGIELGKGVMSNDKFMNLNLDNLATNSYEQDLDWFAAYENPNFVKKMNDWVGNKRSKQTFLNKLIGRKDQVVSDLEKVKTLDAELYQIYLREIYKNFIDNDKFASNAIEVKKIVDSMQTAYDQKENQKRTTQQKKEDKKNKLKEKVLSGNWSEADFAGRVSLEMYDLDDFSNIYESDKIGYTNQEIAEEMFQSIGLKLNDSENIVFGISAKNLTKIFNNIKKAKTSFAQTNIGQELDQQKIDCNFDYMAKKLAETVSRQLHINSWSRGSLKTPSADDILSIFYPGPYCED